MNRNRQEVTTAPPRRGSIALALVTLGCPKNQVDSEHLASLLQGIAVRFEEDYTKADAVIVNTCGFIGDAKQESVETILTIAENAPQAYLIVFGCLSELYKDELKKEIPEINAVFGVHQQKEIAENLKKHFARSDILSSASEKAEGINKTTSLQKVSSYKKHHAYIKIAEGCSNSCSFCIIPKIRGTFTSRPPQEIIDEIKRAADNGVKEIDLVAQDSTMYGIDLKMKNGLLHLLEAMEDIPSLEWIRILYGYPTFYHEELIQHICRSEKCSEYFDIPFQHVSDTVLQRMNRQERKKDLYQLLDTIQKYGKSPFIRTAFIVGFPGETEEEFKELSEFIRHAPLQRVGVFGYSHEELSDAYRLQDSVPPALKEERVSLLQELAEEKINAWNKQVLNTETRLIVDGYSPEEMITTGRTPWMVPEIDGDVILEECDAREGEIITVTITGTNGCDLIARQE